MYISLCRQCVFYLVHIVYDVLTLPLFIEVSVPIQEMVSLLSWSYGSWIYNFLWNRWQSPLKLWVWIPLRWGVLDTTLCDKVYQWHSSDQWFCMGTPVSFINKTYLHNIAKILLKVALNTIT
jgi:hypothetical protein